MSPAPLLSEIHAPRRRWTAASADGRRPPAIRLAAAIVVACLVAAGAVLATSWEPLRHQLALSFSQEPARYLEVFLTSPPTGADLGRGAAGLGRTESPTTTPGEAFPLDRALARARSGGGVPLIRVPVTIRSHAEALVRQPITLQVRRAGQVVTRRSLVSVPSGGTAHVVLTAPVPRALGPWSAEVSLPGRPERLLLHGDAPGGGFGG